VVDTAVVEAAAVDAAVEAAVLGTTA
jgi:hypothetical protein